MSGLPRPAIPPRGVLLHIGPHKTGTTAIQTALAAARDRLETHGVIYPGGGTQHRTAALAITEKPGAKGIREGRPEDWDRLVRHVRAARRRRVVVSSEAFVEADRAAAAEVVRKLGDDRVHVVVTLRPLAKILPSAWQQNVRNQLRASFDAWLEDVLVEHPDNQRVTNFWHRHAHDVVVERWMEWVGPERVAVVVGDDRDRRALPRSFERLLDLPEGFLALDETRANRGLTRAEIELVRQLNVEAHARGWSADLYHEIVHLGAIRGMQERTPGADEPGIVTPGWAVARANEIARTSSERIRTLGVAVLGDLDTLSAVPAAPAAAVVDLSPEATERALAGVHARLELMTSPPPPEGLDRPIPEIPARDLVGIVGQRLDRRVRMALGRGIPRYE